MHLYVFLKAKAALHPGKRPLIFLALFLVLMISAPFFVRFYEKQGFETFAYLTANVGFLWMGVMLIFFVYGVAIDGYKSILFIIKRIFGKDLSRLQPSSGFAFFAPLLIAILIASYGYFEALDIKVEKVIVRSSKIPASIGKIKIVQISDVHLGHIVREERLRNILDKVKAEEPDMLVCTGDLIDGQRSDLNDLSNMFKEIRPKYGKFAITGNHEYYAGLEKSLEFIERAGFTLLRGEGMTIDGIINIAGVDDGGGEGFGDMRSISEKELLSGLPSDKFTLFLKHRPLLDNEILGLYDLQLSGHTHKGQIFPFNFFVARFFPFISGYHKITDISAIYVSRGTGTWGPPIRFMSPPEVTVIELLSE
ncbi:MAG: metallophosphoesterase [Thermodesulfovibrionia bacterium]|nr:metallophosphoesterase [Thermodesulfovibrionia bacterium]